MAYKCPFCGIACRDDGKIEKCVFESFEHSGVNNILDSDSGAVILSLSKCPECGKVYVELTSDYRFSGRITPYSYPPEGIKPLPEYVPQSICADYIEAATIVNSSPKASATLSRRCLQGMIRDFWGIKKGRLVDEIVELKGNIPPAQWEAIDALRKIGNIGAHMEKDVNLIVDVDPSEAKRLLKLIELLIDKWYIARHDEEQLLKEIVEMSDEKESIRKSRIIDANSK